MSTAAAPPTPSSSTNSFGTASHQVDLDEMERRVCAIQVEHGRRGCSTPSQFSSESLSGSKVATGSEDLKTHVAFDVASESETMTTATSVTPATVRLARARQTLRDLVYQWSVRTIAFAIFSGLFVGTLSVVYFSQL